MSDNSQTQELEPKLDLLRRDVDAIKGLLVSTRAKEVPWFRNGALLLAVAAFFFSCITYLVSQEQVHRQLIRDTRLELRNILIQLNSYTEREIAFPAKYTQAVQSLLLK